MNLLAQLREQVVTPDRKMKFGSQSKLAVLLGCSQDVVRQIVLGNRELEPEQCVALRNALTKGVELFSVKAATQCCDEPRCKRKGYAKGKCRKHYFLAWKRAMQTV